MSFGDSTVGLIKLTRGKYFMKNPVLCHVVSCCVVLCCVMLCCVMLCHVVLRFF